MSMQAIGVYISTLRHSHSLTQKEVADAADTTITTIYRYEHGKNDGVEMPLLFRVVQAVRGRGDDIMKLILTENPTDDYARTLAAEALLTPEQRDQATGFFTSDDETRLLLETIAEATRHNKTLLAEIRGYLSGIIGRAALAPNEAPPRTSRRRRDVK